MSKPNDEDEAVLPLCQLGSEPWPEDYEEDDSPDDDEETETPPDVAALLGFDPDEEDI